MIKILIKNSNQCQLDDWDYTGTEDKIIRRLFQDFSIKHPNAYYIKLKSKGNWDGVVHYINKGGYFNIGLLKTVCNKLDEYKAKYVVEDLRRPIGVEIKIPRKVGNLELRDRQLQAVETILNNKVGGIPFLICSANYSVNFGKSLIFCAIHKAFQFKLKTILLLNDATLFDQFKNEIPLLLPEEKITFVQGGKVMKWSNFTVAMVQSVAKNIKTYESELMSFDIVLLDEADVIDNDTYNTVIKRLYNSLIRIGLSGTLYANQLKKFVIHNMNVKSFIGEMVDEVTLIEQIKAGYSTPTIVKTIELPDKKYNKDDLLIHDYLEQYESIVINSQVSYDIIKQRLDFNLKYGRKPLIVVAKYIKHCELIYKFCKEHYDLKIGVVHVDINKKVRKKTLDDFRDGNLDILVTTKIIFRGKNLPLLRYVLNVSSMDSKEGTIQLLGRLVRKHTKKTKAYIDDIIFPGTYLIRHGHHRKNYYLNQGLKVIQLPRDKNKRRKKYLKDNPKTIKNKK